MARKALPSLGPWCMDGARTSAGVAFVTTSSCALLSSSAMSSGWLASPAALERWPATRRRRCNFLLCDFSARPGARERRQRRRVQRGLQVGQTFPVLFKSWSAPFSFRFCSYGPERARRAMRARRARGNKQNEKGADQGLKRTGKVSPIEGGSHRQGALAACSHVTSSFGPRCPEPPRRGGARERRRPLRARRAPEGEGPGHQGRR